MRIYKKPLINLFYLYAALNYNGYDKENNSKGMHPFRKKVRDYLQNKFVPKFNFCFHPYQYTKEILINNLIISSKTNPDFIPTIEYLQRFIKETNLTILEKDFLAETKKAIEPYSKTLPKIIKITQEFFTFQPESQKIIFTVNLLESYYRGFSIQIEKTGYLITGPSESPNIRNLLHELIHFYINTIKAPEIPASHIKKLPKEIIDNYDDFLLSESLIRALVIYLSRKFNLGYQELNLNDELMLYPQRFLELLSKGQFNHLSKNQIKGLFTKIINNP